MKKSILTTLSVLATGLILISPVCHADTPAQQREQAAINDNNTINDLSDPSESNQYASDDNNDQSNDDADNGDSSSNSDDGND